MALDLLESLNRFLPDVPNPLADPWASSRWSSGFHAPFAARNALPWRLSLISRLARSTRKAVRCPWLTILSISAITSGGNGTMIRWRCIEVRFYYTTMVYRALHYAVNRLGKPLIEARLRIFHPQCATGRHELVTCSRRRQASTWPVTQSVHTDDSPLANRCAPSTMADTKFSTHG